MVVFGSLIFPFLLILCLLGFSILQCLDPGGPSRMLRGHVCMPVGLWFSRASLPVCIRYIPAVPSRQLTG